MKTGLILQNPQSYGQSGTGAGMPHGGYRFRPGGSCLSGPVSRFRIVVQHLLILIGSGSWTKRNSSGADWRKTKRRTSKQWAR